MQRSLDQFDDVFAALDERTRAIVERRREAANGKRRGRLVRRVFIAVDTLALIAAFSISLKLVEPTGSANSVATRTEFLLFLVSLPGWVFVAKLYGLYNHDEARTNHTTTDDIVGVFHLLTVGIWLFFAATWVSGVARPDIDRIACFWALGIVLVIMGRSIARARVKRNIDFIQNAVIVGAGNVGQLIARKLLRHPEYGINVVGFVDSAPKERLAGLEHVSILGPPERLPSLVQLLDVERVIVAFSSDSHEELLELVRVLKPLNVTIDVVPRLFDVIGPNAVNYSVEGVPLVGLPPVKKTRSAQLAKRGLDIAVAVIGLIVTAPLFVLIAVLIKRDSRGSVLFRQTRLGLNMEPFSALKFRTMFTGTDDEVHRRYIEQLMDRESAPNGNGLYKLERPEAVTRVGKWLRRTSLDELPQLVNVLRGEMSVVGPRPCIEYETANFAPRHFERFLARPGITGLWQVTARGSSTFAEALDMDVAYVRSWSLGLDLRLMCRTPWQVVMRRGTA
jgi:exopolysaccharide biosynthesis polyprenyl glycosylphosphotransferase